MIVNGRAITKEILRKIREDSSTFPHQPVVRAIVLQPSAATESYLRIKERRAQDAGMILELIRMGHDSSTEDVICNIQLPGADSIIVQLPLPSTVNTEEILNAIPIAHDADVLSKTAHDRFEQGDAEALLPPVVAAVKEILERAHVDPKGKRTVVVGKGWLVGEPVTAWLHNVGANVTTVGKDEGLSILKDAEIIVSGAGSPGIITPDLISSGVVLIDAGTSESDGAIVGDAHEDCADIASLFTPVPGGVGPIAVACLFRNAAILAMRASLQTP